MEQVIQNKIFNAKAQIAEIQAREDNWFGDNFWCNGVRGRICLGLTAAATIIAFIFSLFFVDNIAYVFLTAFIAFVVSVFALVSIIPVDESFNRDYARWRLHLGEARKELIEYTLDARIHEGDVSYSGDWNELTIERDNAFEKIMARIVDHGETEAVETKPFLNG